MDSDLRDKISDRLPSIEDQEQAAAAAAARDSGGEAPGAATEVGGGAAAPARVTLTPATLARALPHIRRLTAESGGDGGQTGSVRSALGLLRGGGLVFPEAHAAAAAAVKQTEVRYRASMHASYVQHVVL